MAGKVVTKVAGELALCMSRPQFPPATSDHRLS